MQNGGNAGESPAAQRRRLLVILRDLREARGLSEREVAAALGWQPLSKLLRIERGMVDVSIMDLCVLLNHYGVDDSAWVEELVHLAGSTRRDLYDRFRDILPSDYFYYLQYESAASVIRSFEPSLIPGLLQTREYAQALFALQPVSTDTAETITRRIDLRMERQKLLGRADEVRSIFVLDEAALHHRVGGRSGMVQQLKHLRAMGARPNVEIRIIPFHHGAHLGLWGGFVVLEFPSPNNSELLFVEHQAGEFTTDGRTAPVASFVERFWILEDASASVRESGDMIDRILNGLMDAT